jgi:RNA polymerase sigma-70 factor (ECF subfamily)
MVARPVEPADPPLSLAVGVKDGRRSRSAQHGQAVTGQDVRAALATLSAEHRQVIVEIYYHHRSVAETADLLCMRASKVASLAYSATCQLPRALAAIVSCRAPSPYPSAALLPPARARRPARPPDG